MKISPDSLKQHDYNQNMQKLIRKGVALKKKSEQLKAKLKETFQKCDQLLHSKSDQGNPADGNH